MNRFFRGFFKQPRDLNAPFSGDPVDLAREVLKELGDTISERDAQGFTWYVSGTQEVRFEYGQRPGWLRSSFMDVTASDFYSSLMKLAEKNAFFKAIREEDGTIKIFKEVCLAYQGEPKEIVDSLRTHWLEGVFGQRQPPMSSFFRSYLNGRKFIGSSEAFIYFLEHIKGDRRLEDEGNQAMFDTGGVSLGISKEKITNIVMMAYVLGDFTEIYQGNEREFAEFLNRLNLSHPQINVFGDQRQIMLLNLFYVSNETDALDLFTAQLQAIHDAAVTYDRELHEGASLAWARQALRAQDAQRPTGKGPHA